MSHRSPSGTARGRRTRPSAAVATGLLVAVTTALGACDGDDAADRPATSAASGPADELGATTTSAATVAGSAGGARPEPESLTALAVCEGLEAQDNRLADAVNTAIASIGSMAPDERDDALRTGFADTLAAARDFADHLATWDLPDVAERDRLLTEMRDGADAAVAELEEEAAPFAGLTEVSDAAVQGQVGVLFNAVEKAMSVLEPRIGRYEGRALQEAFLAEPACQHVIQPFTLD